MDTIKCPVCGQVNPADAEFCQNCMSRLQPLTGPLKAENAPLQPGQAPTKKVTAELEPILPQWLRDAREKARQSASEDAADLSLSAKNPMPTVPSTPDLLAGLASQGNDDEEEVPDWLASLTGNAPANIPAKKKMDEPEAEDTQPVKWVELGGPEDFEESSSGIGVTGTPPEIPVENNTPSWMMPQEPAPEKDERADWFSRADQSSPPLPDQSSAPAQPIEPTPSTSSFSTEDVDWLKNSKSKPFAPASTSETQSSNEPKDFDSRPYPATKPLPASDVPDWLNNLQAQRSSFDELISPPAQEEQPTSSQSDWSQSNVPMQRDSAAQAELPDWLKTLGQTPAKQESSASLSSASDLPDWLKAAAPQSDVPSSLKGAADVPQTTASTTSLPSQDIDKTPVASETPDWLLSLKSAEPEPSTPTVDLKAPAFTPQETSQPSASTPAFAEDNSTANADVDAIFASMQIPDWLMGTESKSTDQSSSEASPPLTEQTEGAIAPAELPSWVQAMRPVKFALPFSPASSGDSSMEAGGPLAGLQNVLPAGPGFGPTSKPKSYSIKLNVTSEHQTQAALLEQILAAETVPVPMKAASVIMSQRVLRWTITALMILLVGGILFAGT